MQFSSVLMLCPGEGEEREDVGDILGNRLCPGENSCGALLLGGWKAEGKDLRMGGSPDILNIGLKAAEAVRAGSLDSRAGCRKGGCS